MESLYCAQYAQGLRQWLVRAMPRSSAEIRQEEERPVCRHGSDSEVGDMRHTGQGLAAEPKCLQGGEVLIVLQLALCVKAPVRDKCLTDLKPKMKVPS